ncbi:MAG TPA: putative Ig domain-containing protein [Acidimicrobiales bacterium]|nr:putative Ig domain-containing protein [Acidimicrobiales bacterium]
MATAAAVVAGTVATVGTWAAAPAQATTPSCSSVGVGMTELGGPNFYIDGGSTPAFTGAYTGYSLTNSTGSPLDDVWVSLSGFTGGALSLAPGQAAAEQIPSVANAASAPLFWYLAASAQSSNPQGYTATVYDHNPALPGSTPLCSTTGGFSSVDGTIAASANKVTGISLSTTTPPLGGTFSVTVAGNTGTIGQGLANDTQSFWMSPTVAGDWPAGSFRLVHTALTISPDGSAAPVTYHDILRLSGLGSAARDYTAVYTIEAVGFTSAPTNVQPVQEIASGTQVKHTGSYSVAIPAISPPANTSAIAVTAAPGRLDIGGGDVAYAASLSGTAGENVDSFAVTIPATASYVAGSATYAGSRIADPVASGSTLDFTGPFDLAISPEALDFAVHFGPGSGNQVTTVEGLVGVAVIDAAVGDTTGSSPATATVNVDTAPVATAGTLDVAAGSGPVTVDVSPYVSDADDDPLTVTSAGPATSGTVSVSGGVISYTPPASPGSDSFDYVVSDGRGGTATGSMAVTVTNQATQTITFPAPGALTAGGSEQLGATASSGLPVTYTTSTPAVCTVSASTLSASSSGTCSVTASQAGDATYAAASAVTASVQVALASQTITATTPTGVSAASSVTLTASASSGLPLTSTTSTPSVCTVDPSGTVTALTAGTCSIELTQPGNGTWAAATPVTVSFPVALAAQAITFPAPAGLAAGGSEQLAATASSGLPVTYATSAPAVCTVDPSGTVTALTAGTCAITASQAGDSAWAPATPMTASFAVTAAAQTITFPAPPGLTAGGSEQLAATASSGLPVTYTTSTPAVCSLAGSMVTAVGAGTCTLTASQAGNATWAPAPQVTDSLTVTSAAALAAQTITFPAPAGLTAGGSEQLAATATSGLAVTYTSTTTSVCTVDPSGTVTALAAGTCTLTADQAGDSTWAPAAPVTENLTVAAAALTVSGAAGEGEVGAPYHAGLAPSGGQGPFAWTVTAGTLPPGVTLDPATGQLEGTATAPGSYPVTVTVADAAGQSAAVEETITVAPAPATTGITLTDAAGARTTSATSTPAGADGGASMVLLDHVPLASQLTVAGGTGPFTWTANGAMPAGLTLSPGGVWQGRPVAPGTYHVTVTVTDAAGMRASETVTVTVMPPPLNSRLLAGTPDGKGYWFVTLTGHVEAFGDAALYGQPATGSAGRVVGIAAAPDGAGYWLVTDHGQVLAYGTAVSYGSAAAMTLRARVVGMAVTPDAHGYWLVAADGGVFAFGDAAFYGSMGDQWLASPVVGMAITDDGRGYWLTAADGGVFAFGDAAFAGSMAGHPLAAPVEGIAATADDRGYWLIGADGGLFTFGDAPFFGSLAGKALNAPIDGVQATPDGQGLWAVGADGGVFSYGSAPFFLSDPTEALAMP